MRKSFHSLIQIIKQYKWNSIFYKNLQKSMIIVFLPLLLIVSTFSIYYRNVIVSEAVQSAKQNSSTLQGILSDMFTETEQLYLRITNDFYVSMFLSADNPDGLSFKHKRGLNTSLIQYHEMLESGIIDSITIYSDKNSASITSYAPKYPYHPTPWLLKSSDQPFYVVSPTRNDCFSICYTFRSDATATGLVVFNIDPNILTGILIDSDERKYSFALLSSVGNSIYQSGNLPVFSATDLEDCTASKAFIRKQYVNVITPINNTYLYLSELNTHISPTKFAMIYILFFMIALIAALLVALLITVNSYRSIENIVLALNKLENNHTDNPSDTEVTYICSEIVSMYEKNLNLEAKLLTNFTLLKQLQIATLQLQFTPHFLFNTLNVLNLVVMKQSGLENPASRIIVLLSDLLQESLNTTKYLTSIHNELENSKKYIAIESLKSNDDFDLQLDVDENILNCTTVKFSLQPIIENAFKHGIKYLKNGSRGFIKIRIFRKADDIIFEISNNGPCIDSNELKSLRSSLENNLADKHIGLCNVNKRIGLIFGDEYGLDITSENGITTVTLNIPYTTEETE